jgi:hypothetical protein
MAYAAYSKGAVLMKKSDSILPVYEQPVYKRRPTAAERLVTEAHIQKLCRQCGITVDDLYKIVPSVAARMKVKDDGSQ